MWRPTGNWTGDGGIVTVATTDTFNKETSWTNYGSCVDIWAPGVSIVSISHNGGTATMSGTSMASPQLAGAGSLYLSRNTTVSAATAEMWAGPGEQRETRLTTGPRSLPLRNRL